MVLCVTGHYMLIWRVCVYWNDLQLGKCRNQRALYKWMGSICSFDMRATLFSCIVGQFCMGKFIKKNWIGSWLAHGLAHSAAVRWHMKGEREERNKLPPPFNRTAEPTQTISLHSPAYARQGACIPASSCQISYSHSQKPPFAYEVTEK